MRGTTESAIRTLEITGSITHLLATTTRILWDGVAGSETVDCSHCMRLYAEKVSICVQTFSERGMTYMGARTFCRVSVRISRCCRAEPEAGWRGSRTGEKERRETEENGEIVLIYTVTVACQTVTHVCGRDPKRLASGRGEQRAPVGASAYTKGKQNMGCRRGRTIITTHMQKCRTMHILTVYSCARTCRTSDI